MKSDWRVLLKEEKTPHDPAGLSSWLSDDYLVDAPQFTQSKLNELEAHALHLEDGSLCQFHSFESSCYFKCFVGYEIEAFQN